MAKEATTGAETTTPQPEKPAKKMSLLVMILIGTVTFALLSTAIFFVLTKMVASSGTEGTHSDSTANAKKEEAVVKTVYVIKDVIVNPAGTNGTRYLMVDVGLEVSSPKAEEQLAKNETQVRDGLNTLFAKKTLSELEGGSMRDSLRNQVKREITRLVPEVTLLNVYFRKFIIQ
jgi:flagellar FliL protein